MDGAARVRESAPVAIRVCSVNGEWMNDWFSADSGPATFRKRFTRDGQENDTARTAGRLGHGDDLRRIGGREGGDGGAGGEAGHQADENAGRQGHGVRFTGPARLRQRKNRRDARGSLIGQGEGDDLVSALGLGL